MKIFTPFTILVSCLTLILSSHATAVPLVVAFDNSSSTSSNLAILANQCAHEVSSAIRDPAISQVQLITIGSAKNPSLSWSTKIGRRDFQDFLTRDNAESTITMKIKGFPKKVAEGTLLLDSSSAIYQGLFYDIPPLLNHQAGKVLICSDAVENEVTNDPTKHLPKPPKDSLAGVEVTDVGFGLGLDSLAQEALQKTWRGAITSAGGTFIAKRVN